MRSRSGPFEFFEGSGIREYVAGEDVLFNFERRFYKAPLGSSCS